VLTPFFMKLEHFLPLPDQDKEWLNGLVLRSEEFRSHSDIIREGEMPTGVFIVIAGHACRYKILSDGSRQILDFMFPGDKTELYSLLLKATDHGILTLGPTTIARIDRDRLIAEMFDHPHVTVALWWNALQREAILRERITAIGHRDAYARVAHLLCEMFERLTLVGETVDHNYRLPVTQEELGDALGITQVHANRMLRRLENAKLIVSEHRILRIPDLEALKAVAAFDARYLHLDGAPEAVRDALAAPSRTSQVVQTRNAPPVNAG
jgi:CRP-like cAMP-binding protein